MERICHVSFFFFFSSRRRHTRFDCDWSSDVCSSDLSDLMVKVVPFFEERPLVTAKQLDFERFAHVLRLMQAGAHLSEPGLRHIAQRSEEHTSELQSQSNLVCRLLLEKKKKNIPTHRF